MNWIRITLADGERAKRAERLLAKVLLSLGLLERENRVYTKVVESVGADELMEYI